MKRSTRALVGMAAVVVLAGCANPSGTVAFQLGDTTVSNAQVTDSSAGCARLMEGVKPEQVRMTVAQFMVGGLISDAIIQQKQLTVTDSQIDQRVTELQGQPLLADADCARAVRDLARWDLVKETVGAAAFQSDVGKLDVAVNPRYGSWDSLRGTLTGASGSLSSEAVNGGVLPVK